MLCDKKTSSLRKMKNFAELCIYFIFFKFPSTTVVLLNIIVYIVCSIVYTMKFYYAVPYMCIYSRFYYCSIGICVGISCQMCVTCANS